MLVSGLSSPVIICNGAPVGTGDTAGNMTGMEKANCGVWVRSAEIRSEPVTAGSWLCDGIGWPVWSKLNK